MRIGVDFGTTRTIVATADRGNYPVASFLDTAQDAHEYFPSVAAWLDGELVFGFEALAAHTEEGAPLLRSFKRALASPTVNPNTTITLAGHELRLLDVITGYLKALRVALATSSNLAGTPGADEPSAVVAVPAHAHSAQRFLTLDAFRRAGFEVIGMLNEPSAASFEYTHRQGRTVTSKRRRVVVYDLGGGTFDASLVSVDDRNHEVLTSVGVNQLGGDDFDEVLATCALDVAGTNRSELGDEAWEDLLADARTAKEQLSPQSKRIALMVDDAPVTVPVDAFYAAATPLVEETLEALVPLIGRLDGDGPGLGEIAGLYLVGGSSSLPLVPRLLRERFGRRVHRSPYPAASTAIGLAIASDASAGYSLTDRLSRGFGVFREGNSGQMLQFDPIFTRDNTYTPTAGVIATRRYPAAHNVGWFRYVEYSAVDDEGVPRGDVVPFAEVIFPFDPDLQQGKHRDLRGVPVERHEPGSLIEEHYLIDVNGIIEVQIMDLSTGYSQTESLRT